MVLNKEKEKQEKNKEVGHAEQDVIAVVAPGSCSMCINNMWNTTTTMPLHPTLLPTPLVMEVVGDGG